jgi:Carboxypeptidase regulatory-like domain
MILRLAIVAIAALLTSPRSVDAQRGADQAAAAQGPPTGIAGRVIDASGAPVKDALVTALHPDAQRRYGFQPVSARLRAVTNEQGGYVLDPLPPGEYYVVALPQNRPLDSSGGPNRVGYANTFHPNAARVADAARVRVTLGRATADITLAPAKLAVVSGVVIRESGQPAGGGNLIFGRGDGLFGIASPAYAIRSDGRFAVAGLPPATYHLHYREGPWPPPRGVPAKVSGATVTVTGSDIPNVRVEPIPMVRGAGRILVDPAVRASLSLDGMTISGFPLDPDGNPGPQLGGPINQDLTFEFKTWPSVGQVRVNGLPPDWTVGAVRVNGVDVSAKGIEFVAGKDVTNIEIVLVKR